MLKKGSILFGVVFVMSLVFATDVGAQATGTILGTVRDQTGAVMPGTTVQVRNTETGNTRMATSGSLGQYRVSNLPPGPYAVTAELTGFQAESRSGINITIGRQAVVDFALQVGDVAETVTVVGEAPLLETTTSTVSGIVESQQMREIPLNARSFIELVPLQSGAVLAETGGSDHVFGYGKKLSVTGTRWTANSFLLDGADINDSSGTSGSAAGTMAGVETVREFQVITNAFDAEYGRHTGGVISAVTKSGTNDFHGSAFEFLRNDNMDAPRWEDNAFADGVKPEFRRNQFGGSVGGPVVPDRTFFFGSYEGLREALGDTGTSNVPGLRMRAGELPDGTFIGLDPNTEPFILSYPVPNSPDRADGTAQFSEGTTQVTDQNFWTIRGDHRFSDSDSFFVRFTKDDATRIDPGLMVDAVIETGSRFTTMEHSHIYSPTLLGRTHLSFNRTLFGAFEAPRSDRNLPLERFTDSDVNIGVIGVSGLTGWGGSSLRPRFQRQNVWQFKEELFYTQGRHSMKFGYQYERIQFNVRGDFNGGGTYSFDTLRDYMENNPEGLTFTTPGSESPRSWVQSLHGMYIQDDIFLRPGLTLNLGIRYEFITVPSERHGREVAIPDVSEANIQVVTPDDVTVGPLFENPSLTNFAPRVGFAWDVLGTGRTSLRGGIGVFHEQILPMMYVVPGNRMVPFFSVTELQAQDVPGGIDFPDAYFTQQSLAAGGRPQIDGLEYFIEQPATYKWSLTLEQQVAADTTVEAGYNGSRGTHLMRGNLQLNTTPSEFRDLGGQQRRFIRVDLNQPSQAFNRFRWRFNDGSSNYHAFNANLTKRYRNGLQFGASYSYSRSTDDGSAFLGSGDFTNDRQPYRTDHEWALSSFDVRHTFSGSFIYELPGQNLSGAAGALLSGWSVSGVFRTSTGNPQAIVADQPRQGSRRMIFVDGPEVELIPGGNLNPSQSQNPDEYFDVNQFCFPGTCLPDRFFQGNVGVNTLIGPGVANVDFTLIKKTAVPVMGEAGGLEFRAEFFNLFNRPNFMNPAVNLFTSTGARRSNAGEITSTRTSPRQVQLALRLVF